MTTPPLRLFVYGSLKRGFNNHDIYCRGVRSIERTHTPGKLYRLPSGYPVLTLPESRFLARGTEDPFADLDAQERFERADLEAPFTNAPSRGKGRVHGELLTFGDPTGRLRAIDSLEEFQAGHSSRYDRVLVLVYSPSRRAALPVWTYVAGALSSPRQRILTGRWPGYRSGAERS